MNRVEQLSEELFRIWGVANRLSDSALAAEHFLDDADADRQLIAKSLIRIAKKASTEIFGGDPDVWDEDDKGPWPECGAASREMQRARQRLRQAGMYVQHCQPAVVHDGHDDRAWLIVYATRDQITTLEGLIPDGHTVARRDTDQRSLPVMFTDGKVFGLSEPHPFGQVDAGPLSGWSMAANQALECGRWEVCVVGALPGDNRIWKALMDFPIAPAGGAA